MTISSTNRKAGPYLGNDVTTVFPFAFKVFSASDVLVVFADADGAESNLTPGAHYTVSLNANQNANPGGAVTMLTAPESGTTLTITSSLEYLQQTDITNNGGFFPAVLNNTFDRLVIYIQQLAENLSRSLKAAISTPADFDTTLPAPLPFNVIGWNSDGKGFANFAPVDNTLLSADLANNTNGKGSGLIGFRPAGTGAVGRTAQDKLREVVSVRDFGAVGDGSTNDTAAIAAAIASGAKQILLPAGKYIVTGQPSNPYGREFIGPGTIIERQTVGGVTFDFQHNSYADQAPLLTVGREYLYRPYRRLMANAIYSAAATVAIEVYGDSTIAGDVPAAGITAPFQVQNLIPALLRAQGIPNVSCVNRGVSGTRVADLDVIPHITDSLDLVIIKYGINDADTVYASGLDYTLNVFQTNLRAKLAAIRAVKGVENLGILLMGPNSTNVQYGQNTPWYEALRGIYVQAARDYKCCYFDTYAYLRDSQAADNFWMDDLSDGRAIHPKNEMVVWIWGKVIEECFGWAELRSFASNSYINIGEASSTVTSTTDPINYPIGLATYRATVAGGFPADGYVRSEKSPDGYIVQELWTTGTTRPRIFVRVCEAGTGVWSPWSGKPAALTLQNSWVAYSTGWSQPQATIGSDGRVTVDGTIKSGTTTAGTVIATLPAGYRPPYAHVFVVATNGGTAKIYVQTNGNIEAGSTLDATYTSLSGINFRAA